MASKRRKSAAIALAFIGVAGLSLASASTLDITGGTLQAGTKDLTNCQVGSVTARVAAGTYSAAIPGFQAGNVALSNITAACVGKTVSVQLLAAAGAPIGTSVSMAIPAVVGPATTAAASLSTPAGVSAAAVAGVAVVISD
jgi:hypothetical protein